MATIDIIIKAADKASGNFDKVGSAAKRMEKQLMSAGTSMTRNLTLPIVGIGVAAVKAASDMDTALRNIQSVGKQTEGQIQSLSQTFRDMSISAEFGTETAAGLAEAYYDIQGAGFEGAEAMTVLEASTIAATAGATTTTAAMEGLTAVLNAYGLEAEDATNISDLMFRTVDRGVGSYEELTSSMSNVVGSSNAIGVGFDEVSAALATMSKQGQSFSEASVALNQVMIGFLKPTQSMAAHLKALGYESGLAAVQELGLAGALEAVAQISGGTAEDMAGLFGSVRGLRGALALTGSGAEMFAEDLAAMGDSAGAAQAAMEIQMQSFDNQLKLFKNNFTAVLIEIGNIILPVLNKIMTAITPMIQAFSGLDETTKTWIVTIAALVAAIGPFLIITAQIISAFMTIKTAIVAIKTAMAALNLVTLMNPWVAIIALVAAGILILVKNWDDFKLGVKSVWELMKGFFKFVLGGGIAGMLLRALGLDNVFMDGLRKGKEAIEDFFRRIPIAIDRLKQLPSKMKQLGRQLLIGFVNGMIEGLKNIDSALGGIGQKVIGGIKNMFDIFSPSRVMQGLGKQVSGGLAKGIDDGWNASGGLQPLANSVSNGLKQMGGNVSTTSSFGSAPSAGAVSRNTGLSPSFAGGGGNITIEIETITLPEGTLQEQAEKLMKIIAKELQKRGLSGRSLTQ